MTQDVHMRSWSLAAALGLASVVAGLLGYAIGAGEWKGEVNQILIEHSRRLNAMDLRDDRQDQRMDAADAREDEVRTTLTTLKWQVSYLYRQARGETLEDPG